LITRERPAARLSRHTAADELEVFTGQIDGGFVQAAVADGSSGTPSLHSEGSGPSGEVGGVGSGVGLRVGGGGGGSTGDCGGEDSGSGVGGVDVSDRGGDGNLSIGICFAF
jgi:hypothetical protein